MQRHQGEKEGMESLAGVVAILRYEDRQDLSALLADAYLEFQYLDTGFSMTSDAEIHFVNAAIYAPIPTCKALRGLTEKDHDLILDALREIWAATEAGGTYIQGISFHINTDSFRDEFTHLFTSPTGWQRVDRTMERIRELLVTASTEEHFQEVGVLCREGLISVAQAVFDSKQHPPLPSDDTNVSDTDVKRMLARYVASEYRGPSGKEIRKCVDSTVDLANKVTHRRNSSYRDAALCAQATYNAVGLVALLSGKRDRNQLRSPVEAHGARSDAADDLPF